jgi:hypothetical protein
MDVSALGMINHSPRRFDEIGSDAREHVGGS